jgi:prepilin-type N-terminal cleavage/methylation domain-containing protein
VRPDLAPQRRRPQTHGFSLTELLMAIGIILVAMAILFTVMSAAIRAVNALRG